MRLHYRSDFHLRAMHKKKSRSDRQSRLVIRQSALGARRIGFTRCIRIVGFLVPEVGGRND